MVHSIHGEEAPADSSFALAAAAVLDKIGGIAMGAGHNDAVAAAAAAAGDGYADFHTHDAASGRTAAAVGNETVADADPGIGDAAIADWSRISAADDVLGFDCEKFALDAVLHTEDDDPGACYRISTAYSHIQVVFLHIAIAASQIVADSVHHSANWNCDGQGLKHHTRSLGSLSSGNAYPPLEGLLPSNPHHAGREHDYAFLTGFVLDAGFDMAALVMTGRADIAGPEGLEQAGIAGSEAPEGAGIAADCTAELGLAQALNMKNIIAELVRLR